MDPSEILGVGVLGAFAAIFAAWMAFGVRKYREVQRHLDSFAHRHALVREPAAMKVRPWPELGWGYPRIEARHSGVVVTHVALCLVSRRPKTTNAYATSSARLGPSTFPGGSTCGLEHPRRANADLGMGAVFGSDAPDPDFTCFVTNGCRAPVLTEAFRAAARREPAPFQVAFFPGYVHVWMPGWDPSELVLERILGLALEAARSS